MKKFHVYLTYQSLKDTQRVVIMASSSDEARKLATIKYPNAKVEGPSSVLEVH